MSWVERAQRSRGRRGDHAARSRPWARGAQGLATAAGGCGAGAGPGSTGDRGGATPRRCRRCPLRRPHVVAGPRARGQTPTQRSRERDFLPSMAWARDRRRSRRRKASSASRSPWLEPAWHEPEVTSEDGPPPQAATSGPRSIRNPRFCASLASVRPPTRPRPFWPRPSDPENAPREPTGRSGSSSLRTTFAVGNPYSP